MSYVEQEIAAAGVEAALAQAASFGLTTDYRLGTVQANSLTLPLVLVTLDNDAAPTRCFNMTGPLYAGMRVVIIKVPPSGLYVMGTISPRPLLTADSGVGIASIGTTSTTYTDTGTPLGASFVAPSTGAVLVHFYGRLQNNTTTNSGFICPELRLGSVIGSGTLITAANDQDGMRQQPAATTQLEKHGQTVLWQGLTPGVTYNANVLIRSSNAGNSCSVNDRRVIVTPAL